MSPSDETPSEEREAAPLVLADSLDLMAAAPLAAELLAARGKPAILDASGVQRLGAQCLQILLAARALWSSDGQPWRLVDPSPEFTDAATLMGCPHLAQPAFVLATAQD
jgi:chemotaxis protein CheX